MKSTAFTKIQFLSPSPLHSQQPFHPIYIYALMLSGQVECRQRLIQAVKDHGVKCKKNRYCGLLVKPQFARLFVEEKEENRKVYEIRKTAIHFLEEGDKILLIATGKPRCVLGILEFQECVKLKKSLFSRYFPLHKVENKDFLELSQNWPGEFCYAWHFELIERFQSPLEVRYISGPEVWCYLSEEDLSTNEDR